MKTNFLLFFLTPETSGVYNKRVYPIFKAFELEFKHTTSFDPRVR